MAPAGLRFRLRQGAVFLSKSNRFVTENDRPSGSGIYLGMGTAQASDQL
jgi:hypothetical protein